MDDDRKILALAIRLSIAVFLVVVVIVYFILEQRVPPAQRLALRVHGAALGAANAVGMVLYHVARPLVELRPLLQFSRSSNC
jgi:hypothetical protein